jgi:hypothetical protein
MSLPAFPSLYFLGALALVVSTLVVALSPREGDPGVSTSGPTSTFGLGQSLMLAMLLLAAAGGAGAVAYWELAFPRTAKAVR